MNNQQILDNAPEGATSYAEFVIVELNTYCKKWGGEHRFWDETLNTWINQGWKQLSSRANFRSLADIKRIVELETDALYPNCREYLSQQTCRIDACIKHIEDNYDPNEPWTTPEEVKAILRGGTGEQS
jgi:hypothetical protein